MMLLLVRHAHAYLFIGMAFAFVYRFLGAVQASAFFGGWRDSPGDTGRPS